MATQRRPMTGRVLVQGEIEAQIMALSDELEAETERYADVADLAASAEADYKLAVARTWVGLASAGRNITAGERQARAELSAADELRAWKLMEARRQASKEALLSLRARLDALRTMSANVRAMT